MQVERLCKLVGWTLWCGYCLCIMDSSCGTHIGFKTCFTMLGIVFKACVVMQLDTGQILDRYASTVQTARHWWSLPSWYWWEGAPWDSLQQHNHRTVEKDMLCYLLQQRQRRQAAAMSVCSWMDSFRAVFNIKLERGRDRIIYYLWISCTITI